MSRQSKCRCWCDPRLFLYQRLVPFAAVAVGNFIGIPVLRSDELINGSSVFTPDGKLVGKSQIAAVASVFLTCITRVAIVAPAMTLVPLITHTLVQRCWFRGGISKSIYPFQIGMAGLFTMLATPLCYALFKQTPNLDVNYIEAPLKEKARKLNPQGHTVYFNRQL